MPAILHLTTNLFGWYDDTKKGIEETQRLLTLLIAGNDFTYLAQTKGCVILHAPFKYNALTGICSPWLSLSDNGGEMNVGWVNHDASMVSICSTQPWQQVHVSAETMHYRLLSAIEGTEIDYLRVEEPLDLSVFSGVVVFSSRELKSKPQSAAQVHIAACPATCFGLLPSTEEIIFINAGESGYRAVPPRLIDTFRERPDETTEDICNRMNESEGVTKAQREAMQSGSMFGWEIPAANPASYDEDGHPLSAKSRTAK